MIYCFLNLDGFRKCYRGAERALLFQRHNVMAELFQSQTVLWVMPQHSLFQVFISLWLTVADVGLYYFLNCLSFQPFTSSANYIWPHWPLSQTANKMGKERPTKLLGKLCKSPVEGLLWGTGDSRSTLWLRVATPAHGWLHRNPEGLTAHCPCEVTPDRRSGSPKRLWKSQSLSVISTSMCLWDIENGS